MSDAREAFLDHARTVQQYVALRLSEADTRSYLIDPVLRILGYEGVEHLRREVPVPATKEFVDYELLVDGEPQAIVEAKALRQQLGDRHAGQCVQYASVLGVRWALISNGTTWALYDAHAKGPLVEKRVAEVTLDDEESAERAWAMLSLFSREAFAQPSPLANLLVERVVADELGDADSAAVKALQRAVRSRFDERVSGGAVVRAIERHVGGIAAGESDATPSTAGSAEVAATAEPPTSPAPPPADDESRSARSATQRRGSRVTLGDLVAAELLPADALLEAVVDGVTHMARLHDGAIELDGAVYGSPSGAGKAVVGRETNGWSLWRYRGETLHQLRSRLPTLAKQQEPDAG